MGSTQITPQPDLGGGLNLSNDILKTNPNEWVNVINCIVSRPGGSASGTGTKKGAAISMPPISIPATNVPACGYSVTIPKRLPICRIDNLTYPKEIWTLSQNGNGWDIPISQGNSSLSFVVSTSPTTQTATLNFSSPLNISTAYLQTNWALYADANISIHSNFSVTITFGSSGGTAIYTNGTMFPSLQVLPFTYTSTSGTFDPTSVTYVTITFSFSGISQHQVIVLSDLRFENSSINSFVTNSMAFLQGANGTAPDTTSLNNGMNTSVIVGCQDMYLIGVYPFQQWHKLITCLQETPILSSPIGKNFYFTQIPDPTNTARNLAIMANGIDPIQQFSPCQSARNQFGLVLDPSGEIQQISFGSTPKTGTFTLTFNGQTTANINYNDTAITVQNKLQAISSVGLGNVLVTGTIDNVTGLTVTFQGTLSNTPLPLITATSSLTYVGADGVNVVGNPGGSNWTLTIPSLATGGVFTFGVGNSSNGGFAISSVLQYNSSTNTIKSALQNMFIGGYGQLNVASVTGDFFSTGIVNVTFGGSSPYGSNVLNVSNSSLTFSSPINITVAETQKGFSGPPFNYVWFYKNMLMCAGYPVEPFSVQPSDILGINGTTALTFDNENIFIVKSPQSTKVTGGWDMDDYSLISTDTGLFQLWGSNPDSTTGDFDLKETRSIVGVIEMGAGVRIGQGFYFYSGEDIYVFTGQESVSITNDRIQFYIDNIPLALRRAVKLDYASERNLLTVCIPITASTFQTLTYHLQTHAWGLINVANHYNAACGVSLYNDGTQQRPVFMQFGDSVQEWDPATSNGGAFNFECQTAFNHMGSPEIEKDFMRVSLKIRTVASPNLPTVVNLTFFTNGDSTNARQTINGVTPINGQIDVLLNGVVGDNLSIQVYVPNSTNQTIFSGYTAYWQALEDL